LQAAVDGGIGKPCFVKPVMSFSGQASSRRESQATIAKAWNKALCAGPVREARIIVAGKIAFEFEITQLSVRAKGVTRSASPSATARPMATMCSPGSPSP